MDINVNYDTKIEVGDLVRPYYAIEYLGLVVRGHDIDKYNILFYNDENGLFINYDDDISQEKLDSEYVYSGTIEHIDIKVSSGDFNGEVVACMKDMVDEAIVNGEEDKSYCGILGDANIK